MTRTAQDPLAAAFPVLAAQLPRIRLADLPTPIDRVPPPGGGLGVSELWIKRDDLTSSVYGGNKVRKLEYLLAGARSRGCDAVVTFGGAGSNHALATAIHARRLGLQCYAVLVDQPATPNVGPTLRYHLRVGTRLVHAASYQDSRGQLERILATHPGGGERVYEITWGGSSWLGTVGYVAAALELAAQLREANRPAPEFIYLASGSLGTFIGLVLGLRLAGLPSRVVAARVVPGGRGSADQCAKLYADTNRNMHELDPSVPMLSMPELELRTEFLGAGYAEPTPEATEAVALAERLTGLHLETTYTGKGLAALIADARAGRLAGRRVMFLNTYNSAPYPADLADVALDALPAEFRRYLGATIGSRP